MTPETDESGKGAGTQNDLPSGTPSVLTRILALTNQECVIAECEEAMKMIPLSTFEFTPEEIEELIYCIDRATTRHRVFLGNARRKLEFALTRFKPHPK